jgi:hypothetical protein
MKSPLSMKRRPLPPPFKLNEIWVHPGLNAPWAPPNFPDAYLPLFFTDSRLLPIVWRCG